MNKTSCKDEFDRRFLNDGILLQPLATPIRKNIGKDVLKTLVGSYSNIRQISISWRSSFSSINCLGKIRFSP